MKLIKATSDKVDGVRDRALLCFLADTGCRIGGLLCLRCQSTVEAAQKARWGHTESQSSQFPARLCEGISHQRGRYGDTVKCSTFLLINCSGFESHRTAKKTSASILPRCDPQTAREQVQRAAVNGPEHRKPGACHHIGNQSRAIARDGSECHAVWQEIERSPRNQRQCQECIAILIFPFQMRCRLDSSLEKHKT